MNQKEIDSQREFLSDDHRYRKGGGRSSHSYPETTKPCQGCNNVNWERGHYVQSPSRPVDRVCNECRNLLYQALDSQEARLKVEQHELYFVEKKGYYEGHHPNESWLDSSDRSTPASIESALDEGRAGAGYVIEEVLFRLAESMAADLPTDGQAPKRAIHERKKNAFDSPRGSVMWLVPEQAGLLRVLDKAIRKALLDRSTAGEKHGRNIISQLASGELSIQKLNSLSIGE